MSKSIFAGAARLACAAAVIILLSHAKPAAAQQIPALATLSDKVAAAHPELVRWRATLVEERNQLRKRVQLHNQQCSAVEEGSGLETSCQKELADLRTETATHIEKSNLFNSAVHAAETEKRSEVNGQPGKPAFAQVEAHGQFYFLTRDGRKLTGEDAKKVPLEEGGTIITGTDGHVKMTLPDETVFTVGANTELVINRFVYDPANDVHTIMANLSKGIFRWVTGKTARKDPTQMKVTLPVGDLGIRGTDFEATVRTDGSGVVKLYSGQLQITESKTGRIFLLNAGETVTFHSDGIFSQPKISQ